MILLIIVTSILFLIVIGLSSLCYKMFNSIKGFGLLLEKFVEVNQEFYEEQKNIAKKDKEILDTLVKQTAEVSIIRKYSSQINMSTKSISDIIKSLKEAQKSISSISSELNVSKDIANSLANVSNNIKLLDKIVNELKYLKNN